MWFGIMFLISVASWAPYGMGFTTHSSEEECYNHFLKSYGNAKFANLMYQFESK